MRRLTRHLRAGPLVACGAIAFTAIGCAPRAAEPPSSSPTPLLAPGQRVRGASLFGTDVIGLPTGTTMTPDAAPGSIVAEFDPHVPSLPGLRAGNAVSMALSPDGRTLLVLTAGFNLTFDAKGKRVPAGSSQWVFVYDVSSGPPRETAVVAVPNTFGGIVWSPSGQRFFVSGGPDDVVREYEVLADGRIDESDLPIHLGHRKKGGGGGLGLEEGPFAAGVAITPSGRRLIIANNENDSLSVVDIAAREVGPDIGLRPGQGVPGGEFPYGLIALDERRVVVTSQRDHEIVVVDIDDGKVTRRVRVGSSPTTVAVNRKRSRVYVANANSDTVSVVDLQRGEVTGEIATSALDSGSAGGKLAGANPNWVALSPDESTLYVSDGGSNAVAIVTLSRRDRGDDAGGDASDSSISRVVGFVPTGFYPNAVLPSSDGRFLYVAYGKSPTGPNPLGPWLDTARSTQEPYEQNAANQFSLQLTHGGLHAFPVPTPAVLAKLTAQTRRNNRFGESPTVPSAFVALRRSVKHVIYVIGENRAYDQLFGDLPGADGDPRLVHWGAAITPNQHALARSFVTLDRFFDSGGVSGDGWQWSTAGRSTDVAEKVIPIEYADRGSHSYDWEGMSRNINVAPKTPAERIHANPETPDDPDLLPGPADVGGVDEPEEGGTGRLWDAAMRAGRTVRNYGFFVDTSRYGGKKTDPAYLPPIPYPFAEKMQVAVATRPSLIPVTDPYYRGFDMRLADLWREKEWERELDGFLTRKDFPSLELVRLPHDHLGSFKTALDGVNTPDTQMADHDYALGLMVERLSHTPLWKDTVLIALEDDAQNGSDHVDAHRSLVLFAGGHVRRGGAVVSTVYATPSVLRTIELLLDLPPLGQTDAFAPPMTDVLQAEADLTPFTALVPDVLRSTELPLPTSAGGKVAFPRGDATSWALATAGYDFDHADAVPSAEFNRLLYCRLVPGAACEAERELPADP